MITLRWRGLRLVASEVLEEAQTARVAEHPLISGETVPEVTGREARTLAVRAWLPQADAADMIEALRDQSEGDLEHPAIGLARAIVRTWTVIRHPAGPWDLRVEWAIVPGSERPASPTPTQPLDRIRAAVDAALARLPGSLATALDALDTAQAWAAAVRSAASAAVTAGGSLAQRLADADMALRSYLARPLPAWQALRAVLETLGPDALASIAILPPAPPADPVAWTVWDAQAVEILSIASAASTLAVQTHTALDAAWRQALARSPDIDAYRQRTEAYAAWRAAIAGVSALDLPAGAPLWLAVDDPESIAALLEPGTDLLDLPGGVVYVQG